MKTTLKALLAEPRVPNAPTRVWRDWVLLSVFILSIAVEAMLRSDISMPFLSIPLTLAGAVLLLWRRTYPLATFVSVFAGVIVFDVIASLQGREALNVYSLAFSLIFLYSLFRWGSGRELGAGSAMGLLILLSSNTLNYTGLSDLIGGSIVLMLPALLGATMRYQLLAREQTIEKAKVKERELFARELHDTVAHHVSAIAIQAQAGTFLIKQNSSAGVAESLEVIEEEASRALAEMRSMITFLRDSDTPADLVPQHGLADVGSLAANAAADSPPIRVVIAAGLDDLRPALGAAIYRLAQESVTNAIRHAYNASKIEVRVEAQADAVLLTVSDDGEAPSGGGNGSGFGIIGMTERASLLGGTLEAGAGPNGGWFVRAMLPRDDVGLTAQP